MRYWRFLLGCTVKISALQNILILEIIEILVYFGRNRYNSVHEVSETEIIYQVKASKDDRIDANCKTCYCVLAGKGSIYSFHRLSLVHGYMRDLLLDYLTADCAKLVLSS